MTSRKRQVTSTRCTFRLPPVWMVCMPIFGIPGTPICSLNGEVSLVLLFVLMGLIFMRRSAIGRRIRRLEVGRGASSLLREQVSSPLPPRHIVWTNLKPIRLQPGGLVSWWMMRISKLWTWVSVFVLHLFYHILNSHKSIFQRPARRAPKVDTITNDYTSHHTIGKVWRRWILIWWQLQ